MAPRVEPCDDPFADLAAALFDLDGTLVRTFIDFDQMRRDMHALSARHNTGPATEGETDILEIVGKMAAALGGGERGARARAEAYAHLEALEQQGCANAQAIEGAADMLRTLRQERHVPVAIITRNCRVVAQDLLCRFELAEQHDLLVSRDDVAHFKPHPEPVLHACRALRVQPERTVMVGDLWPDVAAGRAAGARTIGIQWPHDPPGRFTRCPPDFLVASFQQVADLLLGASTATAQERG
jgi:phosphoglycolate phosphatase